MHESTKGAPLSFWRGDGGEVGLGAMFVLVNIKIIMKSILSFLFVALAISVFSQGIESIELFNLYIAT